MLCSPLIDDVILKAVFTDIVISCERTRDNPVTVILCDLPTAVSALANHNRVLAGVVQTMRSPIAISVYHL
jgi:hypothetical protein